MSVTTLPTVDGRGILGRARTPAERRRHYLFEGRGWTYLRASMDFLTALAATFVALASAGEGSRLDHPAVLLLPPAAVAVLAVRGLYRRTVAVHFLDELAPVAGAVSVTVMAFLAIDATFIESGGTAGVLGRAWAGTIVGVCFGRGVLSAARGRARSRSRVGRRTLIVGAGIVGTQVARRLEEHPEYGLTPIGFLDADPRIWGPLDDNPLPVLGSPDELELVVAETGGEHVIFAFTSEPDHGLIPLTRRCEELGVEVSLVPRFFESINDRVALERLGGLPLLGLRALDPKGWQFRVKYGLDRPLALIALLVVAPLLLTAMLAVRLSSPGPVFFRQRRVGRDGKPFWLLKLRTMRVSDSSPGFWPADGAAPGGIEGVDRRTPVGRMLRRLAVDELPQLVNVLRGEMSLVGPRPERPEFVEVFGRDLARYEDRHRVKSGITGWAQVCGLRGQTSLADRVEWDNYYIENWSLWLDAKVLLLTFGAILRSGQDA